MKIAEALDPTGRLTLRRYDARGVVVEERRARNSIVLTGRDLVAKLFIDEPAAPISHVAVGTGTDPVDPETDDRLGNELCRKPLNRIDPSRHLVTAEGRKKVTLTADLDVDDGNGTLTEAGLFNADGVMYNRVTFPAINKTGDFQLTLIWEITF